MLVLFETLKGLFFFLTILVGLFFLRGYYLLSDENFQLVGSIIMPGYLIFVWVIIGYLIGFFYILSQDELNKAKKQKIYIKSFLTGLLVWIALALLYVFIS